MPIYRTEGSIDGKDWIVLRSCNYETETIEIFDGDFENYDKNYKYIREVVIK